MNKNIILSVVGRILFTILIQWWIISVLGWPLTLFLILMVSIGLILGYQHGYIPKDKYYNLVNRGLKGYPIAKVIVQKYFERYFEEEPPITFQINASGKSASITYSHNGRTFFINVPYVQQIYGKMSVRRAYLIRNGKEVEITQQPGIPYSVDANELGGDKIIFKDLSGDICWEFGKKQILQF